MEANKLRYIVFKLDTNAEQYMSDGTRVELHSGTIHSSLKDAREDALEAIASNDANRFIIGTFYLEPEHERMEISCVETHGFKNDRKNITQLSLFK